MFVLVTGRLFRMRGRKSLEKDPGRTEQHYSEGSQTENKDPRSGSDLKDRLAAFSDECSMRSHSLIHCRLQPLRIARSFFAPKILPSSISITRSAYGRRPRIVSHGQDGTLILLRDLREQFHNGLAVFRIERGGGLVREDDWWR